jgi:hypothetical protein
MPSVLQQHGLGRGVRSARLDATSLANPELVLRLPRAFANVAAITRDRISVLAISEGAPFLLRPRDTLTIYIDDEELLMSVLGVYPLAALCQRRGVIDRAVLLLTVA